jgi:hypothetical protein
MTTIDLINSLRKPWKWTSLFYATYLIAIVATTVAWAGFLVWLAMELLGL